MKAGNQAPLRPLSVGEVESLSGNSGDPAQDFPANSFFDVFVEVDVPALGGFPNVELVNVDPLLVESASITSFPPRVLYIHGNSSAVPLYFYADIPAFGIHRGDLFGQLDLAGHGVGFRESDVAEFEAAETEAETQRVVCLCRTIRFRTSRSWMRFRSPTPTRRRRPSLVCRRLRRQRRRDGERNHHAGEHRARQCPTVGVPEWHPQWRRSQHRPAHPGGEQRAQWLQRLRISLSFFSRARLRKRWSSASPARALRAHWCRRLPQAGARTRWRSRARRHAGRYGRECLALPRFRGQADAFALG